MAAHTFLRPTNRRKAASLLLAPFTLLVIIVVSGAVFVSYVLWPTWPDASIAIDTPAIPVTVAGVLFEIPPTAVRAVVQRHPGPHERIDLAFVWPSLLPPEPDNKTDAKPIGPIVRAAGETPADATRLFVTIAALGNVLPPAQRLRNIYPRYAEAQARAGPDGLAILPFRAGTPYEGEDLIYSSTDPAQFFARCTREVGVVPSTCIQERALGAAEITLRFPREWLNDWHNVAAGFDRLIAQLHPPGGG